MTSVRQRLAAKTRRRAVVPIELEPLDEQEQLKIIGLQAALVRAATAGDQDLVEELRDQVAEVQGQHTVEISFTALEPVEFEKVASAYPSPDGADGGMDWHKALPVLAALCADDEDLQDDDYWTEQLQTWSHGEQLNLWRTLFAINTNTPAAHVPKD